jgi:hypothetical protein
MSDITNLNRLHESIDALGMVNTAHMAAEHRHLLNVAADNLLTVARAITFDIYGKDA